jgi:hypothetical protein
MVDMRAGGEHACPRCVLAAAQHLWPGHVGCFAQAHKGDRRGACTGVFFWCAPGMYLVCVSVCIYVCVHVHVQLVYDKLVCALF